MESISEQLLFTTTRIVGYKQNGETSIGTGFIFHQDNRYFLVTNKHVIENVLYGNYTLHKLKLENGKRLPDFTQAMEIGFTQNQFIGHQNPNVDVAVANISNDYSSLAKEDRAPFFISISSSIIPTELELTTTIKYLEEIVFVGYPSGLWDSINHTPIIRKGITATPFNIDFMGEPTFLIDASVFPGSSGSPVFIYYAGSHSDKSGNLFAGDKLFFIGLVAKVYQKEEHGSIQLRDIPTAQTSFVVVNQMIDLGVVFKPITILETIEFYLEMVSKIDENKEAV